LKGSDSRDLNTNGLFIIDSTNQPCSLVFI